MKHRYIETLNTVKLVLRNNIDIRKNKTSNKTSDKTSKEFLNSAMSELMSESVSKSMYELERTRMQKILSYLDVNKEIISSIAAKLQKSK